MIFIARKKREWFPGAVLHVMARGVRRQAIFNTDEDHEVFRKIVEEVKKKNNFEVYCYCCMTNHFHMLIKTENVEIWNIMRKLMSNYARYFNQKYGYIGHLFDSRYVSKLVDNDRYLLEVSRYIHLNPVKAGMVRRPLDYKFSSYGVYSDVKKDDLVNVDYIQAMFIYNPIEQYRQFVEGMDAHVEMESIIQKDMGEDDQWLPW